MGWIITYNRLNRYNYLLVMHLTGIITWNDATASEGKCYFMINLPGVSFIVSLMLLPSSHLSLISALHHRWNTTQHLYRFCFLNNAGHFNKIIENLSMWFQDWKITVSQCSLLKQSLTVCMCYGWVSWCKINIYVTSFTLEQKRTPVWRFIGYIAKIESLWKRAFMH